MLVTVSMNKTYTLCFGKPIWRSICSGVRCCLDILVGVGFLLGGNAAIVYIRLNSTVDTFKFDI